MSYVEMRGNVGEAVCFVVERFFKEGEIEEYREGERAKSYIKYYR